MRGLRDYKDRVGIVTGASSGMGAEFARQLAAKGMRVAVLARRLPRLEELVAEITEAGGRAMAAPCDVADRASVTSAVDAVVQRWGQIDLLVNNAGFARHVLFKDHELEDVERMVQTNVLGPIYCVKAVLPTMRAQGRGFVVNISSVAGRLGQPDEAVYSATKFAVTGLSEALSYELPPLGIHVMTVYPALVRTEMFTPEAIARMPQSIQKMFMEPPDFVRATLRALGQGAFEVTLEGRVKLGYALRLLWPAMYRRTVTRLRLPALPDVSS